MICTTYPMKYDCQKFKYEFNQAFRLHLEVTENQRRKEQGKWHHEEAVRSTMRDS